MLANPLMDIDDNSISASLIAKETSGFLREFSRYHLAVNECVYGWKKTEGLPSRFNIIKYSNLPLDAQFTDEKFLDSHQIYMEEKAKLVTVGNSMEFKTADQYLTFATSCDPKNANFAYYSANWDSDVEFGRLFLNGCNPLQIKKCDVIPDKLPVTSQMIETFLEDKTLPDAIKVKVDFRIPSLSRFIFFSEIVLSVKKRPTIAILNLVKYKPVLFNIRG